MGSEILLDIIATARLRRYLAFSSWEWRNHTSYTALRLWHMPTETPHHSERSIPETQTIIRGTLCYQGFPEFVRVPVDIGFCSEETNGFLKPSGKPLSWAEATQSTQSIKQPRVGSDMAISLRPNLQTTKRRSESWLASNGLDCSPQIPSHRATLLWTLWC